MPGAGADALSADDVSAGTDDVSGSADAVPADVVRDGCDYVLPTDGLRLAVHAVSAGYFDLSVRVYAVSPGSDRVSADGDGVHDGADAVSAHAVPDRANDLSAE